ncbi:ER membrane protein complex subunit 1-like [Ptychodera flava]|uniref:ER membrane protein complex subunit 1-like n=1 Tax=Ptychodera flava TaxID=63121 RepID=UPI003969E825
MAATMRSKWLLCCIVIFSHCGPGTALYADQVGKFDWRRQFIGKSEFMEFDESQSGSGRRVLVATESNVLASLNARTGEIVWRQIFQSGDSGRIDAMHHKENTLLTLSGNGKYLRSWDTATGNLIWEEITDNKIEQQTRKSTAMYSDKEHIAVLTQSTVFLRSTKDGSALWSNQLPNSDTVKYHWIHASDKVVYVVGVAENSHLSIVSYSLDNEGEQISQRPLPAAWASSSSKVSCVVIGNTHLVCIESLTNSLHSVALKDGTSFQNIPVIALGLQGSDITQPNIMPLFSTRPEFVIQLTAEHLVLVRLEGGGVKLVQDLPKTLLTTAVSTTHQDIIVTLERKTEVVYIVSCIDAKTGTKIKDSKQLVTIPKHNGQPTQVSVFFFSKKDTQLGYRVMLQTQDYALTFVQQPGKILWTREEALSTILSVEMVDLPVTDTEAKFEDEFGSHQGDDIFSMFMRRLTTQFAQLQGYVMSLKRRLRHGHQHEHLTVQDVKLDKNSNNGEDDNEDDDYMRRDQFNLHKMIVIVTESGKLYGMDSEDGSIIWRHFLPKLSYFERNGKRSLPMFIQRTTAHFPHPPQVVIVGRDKDSGFTRLHTFNPITGKPSNPGYPYGSLLEFQLQQVTMLPFMDQEFLKVILLLDTQQKVHVLPAGDLAMLKDKLPSIYMFTVNTTEGSVAGHALRQISDEQLESEVVWNVQLPGDQVITNVVAKRPIEHVHSQGRVLGDRSVLYKYLNPNLVAITAEGIDTAGKAFLNAYLIDAVTGNIIFATNHKRAVGPIHMIHSENWIVYEYWNSRFRRHEITVLELFEGSKDRNSTTFSSLDPPNMPVVARQSYILPVSIQSLATTYTEKGITNKAILMALQTGGILNMPKQFLDPRRPQIPTAAHKEEGLVPYLPELPITTEAFINYNQTVFGVRGIQTTPAGLESTCLVLVYGLDVFFTRVFPSKMFDVLKDDFDYYFISTVVVGLLAATLITQKLAAMKTLKKAWR